MLRHFDYIAGRCQMLRIIPMHMPESLSMQGMIVWLCAG